MKKVERYIYPAVFTYAPGQEIAVDFPDLGAATSGTNEDDALISARELLGCVLFGLEEDGEDGAQCKFFPGFTRRMKSAITFGINFFHLKPSVKYANCSKNPSAFTGQREKFTCLP